ncbi:MAG: hypothetical protein GF344_09510 [Chitinivibrionales bacterium]|nr:hypothetical protein [Chitinivibrionales bacterium]MBD3357080.1 hypothetical protein [Chitinivibrionales bacterium]
MLSNDSLHLLHQPAETLTVLATDPKHGTLETVESGRRYTPASDWFGVDMNYRNG